MPPLTCSAHRHFWQGSPLPWAEAMEFLEQLLAPGARPPHVYAHQWSDRQAVLWDNRTVHHSVTPYGHNGADPGYAALRERRLCCHTRMTSSWAPQSTPPPPPSASSLLVPYVYLWCASNALRIYPGLIPSNATALGDSLASQPALLLLGALALLASRPLDPVLLVGVVATRALTNLSKGHALGNSQTWGALTDVTLLHALLHTLSRRSAALAASPPSEAKAKDEGEPARPLERLHERRRRRRRWVTPLSASEQRRLVALCAPIVRVQLAIFYAASGFWKLNSSFMHPQRSCGSIFAVQLLEYLPAAATTAASPLPRWAAAAGPTLTLLAEVLVPVCQLLPARWLGIASTLLFHLLIAINPPPNNIATYGATTVPRLFFWLPSTASASLTAAAQPGWLGGLGMALAALAMALSAPMQAHARSTNHGSGPDLHLGFLCWLAVPLTLVCMRSASRPSQRSASRTPASLAAQRQRDEDAEGARLASSGFAHTWQRLMVAFSLVYAFVLPILGLQERGGCLMFSQLRLHGGSNHLLLPTGLLQRRLVEAEPANALAGGIVRIESTDLHWVHGALAEHLSPHTLALLRAASFDGAFFPVSKASKRRLDQAGGPIPRPLRFTLHSLGLRRLLAEAAARNDSFTLTYTRLQAAEGDEAWRRHAKGARHTLVGDAVGRLRCRSCDARELALLAPPSAWHWASALTFLLAPQPNPIVADDDVGEMHCISFG